MRIMRKKIGPVITVNRVYRPKGLVATYQWAEHLQAWLDGSELSPAERSIVRRMRDTAKGWGLAENEHRLYWRLSGYSPSNPDHVVRACCCGFDRCHGLYMHPDINVALRHRSASVLRSLAQNGVNDLTRKGAQVVLNERIANELR